MILLSMFLFACTAKRDEEENVNPTVALLETDRAFSNLSSKLGMKKAFIEYLDSNGVLLKPGYFPIVQADAIDYLIRLNDTGFIYTWQPKVAEVASSGDLGYTYGIYSLKPSVVDTVFYGTYVSIWKKQEDGKWKFVLNSGNEGLGSND